MSTTDGRLIHRCDAVVVGGGVMGCTTALFLARGGMRVALIERDALCRGASGVNAGTLTLHMTRAALIPYALHALTMWMDTERWLGGNVGAVSAPGLCLAFTESERDLLRHRAHARVKYGAPIELLNRDAALRVEPGLNPDFLEAAVSPGDGFASAYLTGRAYHAALKAADVGIFERTAATRLDWSDGHYHVHGPDDRSTALRIDAKRLVLAGGVWLEPLCAMLNISIPVKTLVNQLIVTERVPPIMRSVLSIANGLLSMKQFGNGSVLIGGGWQGAGDRLRGAVEIIPQNLIGNLRLAQHVIPALAKTGIARVWLGLESETADGMPMIGPLPGERDAWVIGCVHSGYTIGPYMGRLLARTMLGETTELPLFDPARLVSAPAQSPLQRRLQ